MEDYDLQLRYSRNPDAYVGLKSVDSAFFGSKTHIAMPDERIITAAIVTTGEKSDSKYLQELVEKSRATGIEIQDATTIFAVNLKRIVKLLNEKE